MDKEYRLYIYAFLSRVMSDIPDAGFVRDLKKNSELLGLIGEDTAQWFGENSVEDILDALNTDFTTMYVINTQPIESFVLDAKNESLVGLQNPVMAFYFQHGFEVDMNQTEIVAPDHLSIEFAFMQTLIYRDEQAPQIEFLKEHLISWVVPYMMGMRSMATTPFYRDMCDFIIEFLTSEYEAITEGEKDGE